MESLRDLDYVVDADMHLVEIQRDLLPYLESPFEELLDPDQPRPTNSFYASGGHLMPSDLNRREPDMVRSSDDVAEVMELLGTDAAILTPGANLQLATVHHEELAAGLATAYNNWFADEFADNDHGAYGVVLVAPQRPEAAAAEIERHAEEDHVKAVFVPSGGAHPPLGRERYFPLYEAAEDAGLPVLLHAAAPAAISNFPKQVAGTKRFIDVHAPYHPAEQMWHLSTMLTNGLPVRFPDLDIVIQEAGIGWVPYFVRRYENEYAALSEEAPLLEKRPTEYVREQFYFTSQPVEGVDDPEYVESTIRLFDGVDNLLFSSDYPHYDFDHSDGLLAALRGRFSDDEIARIYGENAGEVFGL